MVLLPTSRFLQVYNAIKADKHNSEERGIIVFVANGDVDSLCSMASLEVINWELVQAWNTKDS